LILGWVYQNEAAARAWIDAFFFRVSATIPPEESMVLIKELPIKPTAVKPSGFTQLHGNIDYTATVVPKSKAGKSVGLSWLSLIWLTPIRRHLV
jgi:hypothetical protein